MSGIMQMIMGGGTRFVKLTNRSEQDIHNVASGTASAYVRYSLTNAGVFQVIELRGGTTNYTGEWLVAGNVADYEVQFTGTGWTTATLNTWLALSTTRTIELSATRSITGETNVSATGTISIRRIGSATNEASCNIDANVVLTVG